MTPVRVTAPAALPITVQEAKDHTIIDFADDDGLVERLNMAATDHLDGFTGILGRCIVNQQWRQDYNGWASCLRLPFPNVSAVEVEYTDVDGATQTVPVADYQVITDPRGVRVQFLGGFSAPVLGRSLAPVQVTFTAGYGAPEYVPWDIKAAICMLVAHWYEQRSAASDKEQRPMPFAVDVLLGKHRWVML